MAIKKSMARNFLLFNYHAFIPIHPPIALTFSTPTPVFASYQPEPAQWEVACDKKLRQKQFYG
jgi:hypothetical protein